MNAIVAPVAAVATPLDNAERFERALGPALAATGPFSLVEAHRADVAATISPAALARLHDLEFPMSLVPAEWGGQRRDFHHLLDLARCLTRRQVALMPATMYGIGPLCALDIAGTEAQRAQALIDTREGRPIIFALSEADAGSDLQTGVTTAEQADDGWRLHGRKWMLGSTAAARHAAVLARSGDAGPAGLSLFWTRLDRGAGARDLPATNVVGMRGIDFGGLVFEGLAVSSEACIGAPGRGLELTLLCQQPVKLLSTAANLGASESALRCAVDWASTARAGRKLTAMAHVRHMLAGAFADLLLLEAVSVTGARALSWLPGQCSILTAAAKHAALMQSERILAACGKVLATRALMRDLPWHGLYERVCRDLAMVQAIDTNPVVNLRGVGTQLDALALRLDSTKSPNLPQELFGFDDACPAPRLRDLQVVNRGGDALAESLPSLIEQVADNRAIEPRLRAGVVAELERFAALRRQLLGGRGALRAALGAGYAGSSALIEQAERYLRVHLAACATQVWLRNGSADDEAWLLLALRRLRQGDSADRGDPDPELDEAVWARLASLTKTQASYSQRPIQLSLHG